MVHEGTPAETFEDAPLSYGQRAIWFTQQLNPDDVGHNVTIAFQVFIRLDAGILRQVIEKITLRHSMLRAVFLENDGQPVQRIYSGSGHFLLTEEDGLGWTAEQVNAYIDRQAIQPFDLERGPLMRITLLRLEPEKSLIILSIHHIVQDLWSLVIIVNELLEMYSAEAQHKEPKLRPVRAAYPELVRREADMLSGPEGEKLLAYWKNRLEGDFSPIRLPIDFPHPDRQNALGATHTFHLEAGLFTRLKIMAGENDTNLFAVFLAAFYVLLYRYTGQNDLLVLTPKARRGLENANTVGYLMNPLVMRGRVDGEMGFRELLAQVSSDIRADFEHDAYPFPLLVEKLNPTRGQRGEQPLQIFFNWLKSNRAIDTSILKSITTNETGPATVVAGIPGHTIPVRIRTTPSEFALLVSESDDDIALAIEYRTSLFRPDTIERMAGHLVTLLQAAASDPDQPVGRMPLMGAAELHKILVEWNATGVDFGPPTCLHRLFQAQAARTPDNIALIFRDRQLTYHELDQQSDRLAAYLQTLAVVPGGIVGICVERSFEMAVGLLGILKAGGAYLPLDPSYPPGRLEYMLQDSGATVLLTQQALHAVFSGFSGVVIDLDGDWQQEVPAAARPIEQSDPANLAYVIYTSGSTGLPKGVMIAHQAIASYMSWMQAAFPCSADDVGLQAAAFSFDASVSEFFPPLLAGGRLVIAEPGGHMDPDYLVQVIQQQKVTTAQFVPSMLDVIMQHDGFSSCRGFKRVFCGGEALSPKLVARFAALLPGVALINLYGPTEVTIDASFWQCPADGPLPDVVPIGRPLANTQLYILDGLLQPVPVGVAGELHVGGDKLARGYWNRPELTAEKFITNPFGTGRLYKTGDLARYLPDGNVEYLGRIDDQVKIRGFRIELGEIETVLKEHPAVSQAVVAVQNDGQRQPFLAGYVTLHKDKNDGPEKLVPTLRSYLKDKLPEYMVPGAWMVLETLPLTPNGKIDRQALPAPQTQPEFSSRTFQPPRTPIEEILAGIWGEVLRQERVSVFDNFFEAGGHSLLATQVASRIRSTFQVNLPLQSLFTAPTIAELAVLITQVMIENNPDDEELLELLGTDGLG